MSDCLTTLEAAKYLKIHPVTLRNKARAGEIPGKKCGGWRFSRKALEAWLAGDYDTRQEMSGSAGWPSIAVAESGGADSPRQTGVKYDDLLKRGSGKMPKSTKTS